MGDVLVIKLEGAFAGCHEQADEFLATIVVHCGLAVVVQIDLSDTQFLEDTPLRRFSIRLASEEITCHGRPPLSRMAPATGRELLDKEIIVMVEEEDVHNAEIGMSWKSFATPDDAAGDILCVYRVDEHVLANEHKRGPYSRTLHPNRPGLQACGSVPSDHIVRHNRRYSRILCMRFPKHNTAFMFLHDFCPQNCATQFLQRFRV
ncbi:MAG: hypothetical protein ABSG65_27200 [Bryobacteraceae bacterium]